MKTVRQYPALIENQLKKANKYKDYMNSVLIENGYKPESYIDRLVVKFYNIFADLDVDNLEGSFWKDVWGVIKTPAEAVTNLFKSATGTIGNLFDSAGESVGNVLGGVSQGVGGLAGGIIGGKEQPQQQQQGKKDNTFLYLGIGAAALVLILVISKNKK